MIKKFIIWLTAPVYKKLLRIMTTIPAYSIIDKSNDRKPQLLKIIFPELGDAVKYIVDEKNMPLKRIKSELKIYPCKVSVQVDKVYE